MRDTNETERKRDLGAPDSVHGSNISTSVAAATARMKVGTQPGSRTWNRMGTQEGALLNRRHQVVAAVAILA